MRFGVEILLIMFFIGCISSSNSPLNSLPSETPAEHFPETPRPSIPPTASTTSTAVTTSTTITTSTTLPPPTSPPPIIEIIETTFRKGPSMNGVLEGTIKNNGGMTINDVQMEAIFYDENGNIVERKSGYPLGTLNPGEINNFIIRTNKLIQYLNRYELIIRSSGEITPPTTPKLIIPTSTTPTLTSNPQLTPTPHLFFNVTGGPSYDLIKIEKLIHDFINDIRLENGLSLINWNTDLNLIARLHSQEMAEKVYFDHINPEGEDFSDRYMNSGFNCIVPTSGNNYYTGGENLYLGWLHDSITYTTFLGKTTTSYDWLTEEEIAKQAVEGWMNSPGHKENILTPEWQTEGIGVAVSKDYKVYDTQNFC